MPYFVHTLAPLMFALNNIKPVNIKNEGHLTILPKKYNFFLVEKSFYILYHLKGTLLKTDVAE